MVLTSLVFMQVFMMLFLHRRGRLLLSQRSNFHRRQPIVSLSPRPCWGLEAGHSSVGGLSGIIPCRGTSPRLPYRTQIALSKFPLGDGVGRRSVLVYFKRKYCLGWTLAQRTIVSVVLLYAFHSFIPVLRMCWCTFWHEDDFFVFIYFCTIG